MMQLEKIKEALEVIKLDLEKTAYYCLECNRREPMSSMYVYQAICNLIDALASLEEKETESGDAENTNDRDLDILVYNVAVNFCGSHTSGEYRKAEKHAKELFIQYAEIVHAQKCAECGKGKKLRDGQPCNHPGCLAHTTHPCEGCGRIIGINSSRVY